MKDNNVLFFRTKQRINAELNLEEFIIFCRFELTATDSDLSWESNWWKGIAIFNKINITHKREPDKKELLDDEFIDFAKAYMKYQLVLTKSRWKLSTSIAVLKVIEQTLLMVNKSADITRVNISVLDEAALTIKHSYKKRTAYDYGQELQKLVGFLSENGLLEVGTLSWLSPIKPEEQSNRISSKAEEARIKKLPDKTALNAMAEIFSLPDDELSERDLFTTSVFALLMCAPSRISEILALSCDCEVNETDSKGGQKYGLRFYSMKGYGADIKWIPEVMVPVAKKAIERLRKISKNAREFALWVENNPEKFFRRDHYPDIAEDEVLKPNQICELLGYNSGSKEGRKKYLYQVNIYDCNETYSMKSLWKIILSKLPSGFPYYYKDIKYSDTLCLLNVNQLDKVKITIMYELQKPSKNIFIPDISLTNKEHVRFENIFTRHGYVGPDGKPLHLRSHQPRHLLNTIAQRNGMSNLDIAKWSGRAKVSQNKVYNHVSEDEMLRKAEALDISSIGSQAFMIDSVEPNLPVSEGMVNLWEHGAIHATEFGYCVHDYMMSPCDKFRDCINCNEQVCVKGDEEKLQRLEERLNMTEGLLSKAKESMTEDELGADRWVKHHESTLSRLRELISILSDDAIPDGSRIKLGGESFTQLGRVLNKFENIENKGNTNYIN
ncbi:integrase [Escherichia coli]|nr:integrase [Escherichia coli]